MADVSAQSSVAVATDAEAAEIVAMLRAETFDKDRMNLAKTLVTTKVFTTSQIIDMASTFDYDNGKVDFLCFAYDYCSDNENYYRAVNILTFSNDKEKVLSVMKKQ